MHGRAVSAVDHAFENGCHGKLADRLRQLWRILHPPQQRRSRSLSCPQADRFGAVPRIRQRRVSTSKDRHEACDLKLRGFREERLSCMRWRDRLSTAFEST